MKPQLLERLLELAVAIQQIPAPSFAEGRRAAFVYELFQSEALYDVTQDALGNVYGRLPGSGSAQPLVITAHLDTVFPQGTDLSLRREEDKIIGPGIGDNALGVAGLFGLLWALREKALEKNLGEGALTSPFSRDVWFVANVGEEGLGNLRGMQAVVQRFGAGVKAYIVLEGMALGHVYHRGLGVKRYRIAVHTPGGHSWVDFGRPSAIHELAKFVYRLCQLPIPTQPRTSLNVGLIGGGTSNNSIASDAYLLLDLRSEDVQALEELATQVERLVQGANRPEVRFTQAVIGERPAGQIPADHPLVRLALASLEALGIPPRANIGSTDANLPLSLGLPAICLGLTLGGGAHTLNEFIYTQPLAKGLTHVLTVVESLLSQAAP